MGSLLKNKIIEVLNNKKNKKIINEELQPFNGMKNIIQKYSPPVNILRTMYAVQMNKKLTLKPNFNSMFKGEIETKEISGLMQNYKSFVTILNQCEAKKTDKCPIKMKKKELIKKLALIFIGYVKLKEYKSVNKIATLFADVPQGELSEQIIAFFKKSAIELLNSYEGLTEYDNKELMELKKISLSEENAVAVESFDKMNVENLKNKLRSKELDKLNDLSTHTTVKKDLIMTNKTKSMNELESMKDEMNTDTISTIEFVKAKSKLVYSKIEGKEDAKPIIDKITNKMIETFGELNDMKEETKKFFISSIFSYMEHTLEHNDYKEVYNDELSFEIEGFNGNYMAGLVGESLNTTSFMIKVEDDKIMKLEYFVIPPKMQGNSVSKNTIKDLLLLSKSSGLERIDLHANINMGGYVWARYGFVPDNQDEKDGLVNGIRKISTSIQYGLGYKIMNPKIKDVDAYNGLVKHFDGTGFDEYLKEVRTFYEKIKNVANYLIERIQDEYGEYVYFDDLMPKFGDVVKNNMVKISNKLAEKFDSEYNEETLYNDLSLKIYKLKMPNSFGIELKISKYVGLSGWRLEKILNDFSKQIKKELNEPNIKIKFTKEGFIFTFKTKINNATFPLKKWVTIPGIRDEKTNLEMFPAGLSGKYGSNNATALNWKGHLDLKDVKRFDIAIEYATTMEGVNKWKNY
jgi:hypothetical protein